MFVDKKIAREIKLNRTGDAVDTDKRRAGFFFKHSSLANTEGNLG